ncbi:SPOR domain-containing protein [Comamonas badia]|uniref:SPOR domain-containing protein n=1 Tax=Comamonas badia TaxID=265291 RepID=UPI000465DCB0|nr:SPOR domain-containing protein [Comamonas badia]
MQDTDAATAVDNPGQQSQGGAGGLAARLAGAALGPVGADHYLRAFDRLDAAGRPVLSWNWGAALAGPAWLAFRGLWRFLLVYGLALAAVLAALAFASSQALLPGAIAAGLALAILLAGAVGLGLRADVLLHGQVQRRIQSAVAAAPTIQQAIDALGKAAPGKARLWLVALASVACAAVLVLAGLAWRGGALEGNAPLRSESVSGPVGSMAEAAPRARAPQPKPEPAAVVAEIPEQDGGRAQAVQDGTEAALAALAKPAAVAGKGASARPPARAPVAAKPKGAAAGKEPARAATASGAGGRRLYINVGIFADPANARRANDQLRQAGLPSAVDTLARPGNKQLQRVRVGPFTSAAQANEAAARVRSLGLDAVPAVQ